MKSDPRYIRYAELKLAEKKKAEAIALEKKRKEEVKKAKEIAKRKEKNRELVRKAQEELERQIKQSKADKLYAKAKSLSHDASKNKKIRELYKQSCNLGHANACYRFGLVGGLNAKEVNNPENKYFQKACKLNDAEACGRIAMLYIKSDFEKCKFYQKKACDLGSSESCVFLANIHKEGFHVKKSDAEYKMYQNKAEAAILSKCRKGDGTECKRLGDIYNPEGVVRNHKSDAAYAIRMYKAGCELSDTHACAALADLYYGGKYTKVDDREVLKLYEKASESIPPFAPMSYVGIRAGEIAYMLKDYTKAARYFEKYCTPSSLDPECSFILGNIYLKGEGVEPNINKAKKFLKQSCDTAKRIQDKITEDVRYGCRAYDKLVDKHSAPEKIMSIFNAKEAYRAGNYSKAQKPFEKACDNGYPWACQSLGVLYENGQGVKQDFFKAKELYGKACNAGDVKGCHNLGLLYVNGKGVKQDYFKAKKLFGKACDGSMGAFGCQNLGFLYENGQGVKQDFFKAKELYFKACDSRVSRACFNLGLLYAKGKGVKQDFFKAKKLFGKACDGGVSEGCKNYSILNEELK